MVSSFQTPTHPSEQVKCPLLWEATPINLVRTNHSFLWIPKEYSSSINLYEFLSLKNDDGGIC